MLLAEQELNAFLMLATLYILELHLVCNDDFHIMRLNFCFSSAPAVEPSPSPQKLPVAHCLPHYYLSYRAFSFVCV